MTFSSRLTFTCLDLILRFGCSFGLVCTACTGIYRSYNKEIVQGNAVSI